MAFSPFITIGDRRIKVAVLCNRVTLRKQHDTFYKVCLMKASAFGVHEPKQIIKAGKRKAQVYILTGDLCAADNMNASNLIYF